MTRAILFDLDRTLVDIETHVDYCAALRDLRDAGVAPGDDLGPETSWGTCTRRVVDMLLSAPDGASRRDAEDLVVPYELEGARAAVAMPGLDRVRTELGGRPAAIVTLLSGPATRVVMDRFDLWPAVVVTRSDDVPAKPAPDGLLLAIRRLGVAPYEVVMVGDSERDAAAAAACDVDFIAITNGRSEHGFAEALAVVDDLDALAELFGAAPDL